MKKLLSLFLVFALICLPICLLTGCGEEEILSTYTEEDIVGDEIIEDNTTSEEQTVSSDKTQSSSNKTAKSKNTKVSAKERAIFESVPGELKGTTVKFATWISHKSLDYAHVFSDFTDLTGIKVDIVAVPQTEYIVKLTGMKASGTAPDVVVDNFEFPRTLPLMQPLIESTTGINVKDSVWDQEVAKLYTVNGKCYAITGSNSNWEMASPLTYYNIPLLKKYGIKTPADYVKDNNWNLD
ncbi:MAG: extracellular solute-binding protein, partial [Clostridia bacterium]|nr:extracellular solute-binding protein [Clostridia bacterium]